MSKIAKTPAITCTNNSKFKLVLPLGGTPKVARVHHLESPALNPVEAVDMFSQAVKALEGQGLTPVFVAGAGFGGARLSTLTKKRTPSPSEYEQCLLAAHQWLDAFSLEAQKLDRHFMFGLDISAACKRAPTGFEAVAQFVAYYDASVRKTSLVAAKRLPTSPETGFLFCGKQPEGVPAILNLPGLGMTLPMVCHDLNVSNPRGIAAQTVDGEQARRRHSIELDLERQGLETAFAAIHSLWPGAPTSGRSSWGQGLCGLRHRP